MKLFGFLPRPVFAWFSAVPFLSQKSCLIPDNVRLLILPGFGNEANDYYLQNAPQGSLVHSLKKRGWRDEQIKVLPVRRTNWLQVFSNGIFDLEFWLDNAPPTRSAFRWYLELIAQSVHELTERDRNCKVVLLAHSAGGWLGRAALGFGSMGDDENDYPSCIDLDRILGMVSLGTPHEPPPPGYFDPTRGALRITHERFPGAYHQADGLFYMTVIGRTLQGVKQERKTPFEPTTPHDFAFNSYETVCGRGDAMGDGVVPVCSAHLDNALQLNLDGIFHSVNVPDKWYGSDGAIDLWHGRMLDQICDRIGVQPLINVTGFVFDFIRWF